MGEIGVAHVWFQRYEKRYSKDAQNTTLDTNYNPNPITLTPPISTLYEKNQAFFF